MKKILALTLLICILCPLAASADVLTGDWKNASDDELNAARKAIIAELAERKNATLEHSEIIELTGSGTAIESIAVSVAPARVTLSCTESAEATLTNGDHDIDIDAYFTGFDQEVIPKTGDYSFLIETKGDWTLTIEPIGDMGSFSTISGNNSFVSDFFTLDKPMIIHIKSEPASDSNTFMLYLDYENSYGHWDYDWLDLPWLNAGDTLDEDLILKPVDGVDRYLIRLHSSLETNWEITAK